MSEQEHKPKELAQGGSAPAGPNDGGGGAIAQAPVIQGEIAEAIEKIPDPKAKALLHIALSRTTLGFGPDPETAKVLSETEMHTEKCRLEGFKSSLSNKDKQNERDHTFRTLRLNREFSMNLVVLLLGALGAASGLYLMVSGKQYGSNVLIASIGVVMYVLKGNTEIMKP